LDPLSFTRFRSENEYVLLQEFLLVSDVQARMVSVVSAGGRGVKGRLVKAVGHRSHPFLELTLVRVPDAELKAWAAVDAVLLEFDGSMVPGGSSGRAAQGGAGQNTQVVAPIHLVAIVHVVDRGTAKLRCYDVRETSRLPAEHSQRLSAAHRVLQPLLADAGGAAGGGREVGVTVRRLESVTTSLREYVALYALLRMGAAAAPDAFVAAYGQPGHALGQPPGGAGRNSPALSRATGAVHADVVKAIVSPHPNFSLMMASSTSLVDRHAAPIAA